MAKKAATKKVTKKKAKKPTIAGMVRGLFGDNPNMETDDMVSRVRKRFPDSAFSPTHVAYYRNKLRKAGMNIPLKRKAKKKVTKKKATRKKATKKK